MKFSICCAAFAALFALTSCNTLIGVGRDTKEGFIWAKNKIQENNQQGQQPPEEEYGAPIY